MKNPLIALLLLLSLEAISRKSSASPTPRYAQNKYTPIPVIVGLTTSLTTSIDRIIEDSIDDSLDEVIREMEVKASKIPWDEKDDYQKVMEGLINSQKYVRLTRSALERFASTLKDRCRGLISMYNRNDPTMSLIQYSVKKFTDLSITVKRQLEKALIELKETSKELTNTKTYLMAFNTNREGNTYDYISKQKQSITWHEAEKIRATIGSTITLLLGAVVGVVTGAFAMFIPPDVITHLIVVPVSSALVAGGGLGFVAHPVYDTEIANIKRRIKEFKIKDKDITSQVSSLINQTDDISNYILEEIELVNDWDDKLAESLREHQEEITKEDLKYGIEEIKERLTDLIEACDNYLEHRFIPDNEMQCIIKDCINYQDPNSPAVTQFDDLSTRNNKMKENCINHPDPNLPDVPKYQISENHCKQLLTEGNVN